jgi:CheY-like chemotaxis protein/predicted transcriptional regulator
MSENIGSFSFDVAKRILDVLGEYGNMKKTNLATKTGLNYNVCLRYIRMLKLLGWLKLDGDIFITELGRHVRKKLSELAKGSMEKNEEKIDDIADNYDHNDAVSVPPAKIGGRSSLKLSSNRSGKKDPNLMIVDDEPDIALTYESFLTSMGYNAKAFSEPYDALRDFASKPSYYYDLVILDIRMHDINGLQLYQSLKAMNPTCRVIFVSALDAAKELVSILPGISSEHIIRKPVERQHFINAVWKVLGTSLAS